MIWRAGILGFSVCMRFLVSLTKIMYALRHFLGVAALIFWSRSLFPPIALKAFISLWYLSLSKHEYTYLVLKLSHKGSSHLVSCGPTLFRAHPWPQSTLGCVETVATLFFTRITHAYLFDEYRVCCESSFRHCEITKTSSHSSTKSEFDLPIIIILWRHISIWTRMRYVPVSVWIRSLSGAMQSIAIFIRPSPIWALRWFVTVQGIWFWLTGAVFDLALSLARLSL